MQRYNVPSVINFGLLARVDKLQISARHDLDADVVRPTGVRAKQLTKRWIRIHAPTIEVMNARRDKATPVSAYPP